MLVPGARPVDLADFFTSVARAAPDAVFMPYLGTWDRHGRPIFAYDLLAYEAEVALCGADVVENPRVFGIARYDEPAEEGSGAGYVRRHHYDVEQVTEGTAVVDVPLHGREDTDVPGQVERRTWPVRFWDGIHEREGGLVAWDRVEVVGTLFENADLLPAWGLDLPLPEVLRRLRLPPPDRWGALRAAIPNVA